MITKCPKCASKDLKKLFYKKDERLYDFVCLTCEKIIKVKNLII